jgi:O-antigen ligase
MANYSNWYRVRMFELSGEMAREHGLLGIGRRNFGKMHQQIAKPGEEIAPHAHNNYLMMIVEQGVLGLIAFVWLQLAVLYYTAKHTLRDGLPGAERAVMGGCLFALLAFGLTGLFHFTMGDAMPASFHWIVVGLAYAVGERRTVAADLPDEAAPKPG